MRKHLYKLITIAILLSACTGLSLEQERAVAPIQESSASINPLKPEPTSLPPKSKPADTPEPVIPVSAVQQSKGGCSPLELERSLILTQWERGVLGQAFIPYDPELGAPLCNYLPIAAGKNGYAKISPDGNLLAYALTQHDDSHDGRLHFVDLNAWTDIPTSIEIDPWIETMAFSPDGSRLAIAVGMPDASDLGWPKNYSLILVDVDQQVIQSQATLEMAIRKLGFTSNGKALMLYGVQYQNSSGMNGEAHAMLLDSNNLEAQWDLKLDGVVDGQTRLYTSDNEEIYEWWGPAAVLSPEMQKLIVVHADSDQLTSVDFLQRASGTVEIRAQMGWLDRLMAMFAGIAHAKEPFGTYKQAVLSADGSKLFVVGRRTESYLDSNNDMQVKETFLGLQVIDANSGVEIAHIDTEATSLAISQDGRVLFLHGWDAYLDWTEILDTESLKIERHVTGRTIQQVMRLDQEPLFLSLSYRESSPAVLALFDPDTLEQKMVWSVLGSAGLLMP